MGTATLMGIWPSWVRWDYHGDIQPTSYGSCEYVTKWVCVSLMDWWPSRNIDISSTFHTHIVQLGSLVMINLLINLSYSSLLYLVLESDAFPAKNAQMLSFELRVKTYHIMCRVSKHNFGHSFRLSPKTIAVHGWQLIWGVRSVFSEKWTAQQQNLTWVDRDSFIQSIISSHLVSIQQSMIM